MGDLRVTRGLDKWVMLRVSEVSHWLVNKSVLEKQLTVEELRLCKIRCSNALPMLSREHDNLQNHPHIAAGWLYQRFSLFRRGSSTPIEI